MGKLCEAGRPNPTRFDITICHDVINLTKPTLPGSPAGMTWEPVDPEEQKYLEIGDQLVMTRDPWFAERMDFWDSIIADQK